jgi:hypothetical protein
MALVSTGGIDPLYSGAQITQRGAAPSWACSWARAGGLPAAMGASRRREALGEQQVFAVAGGDNQ